MPVCFVLRIFCVESLHWRCSSWWYCVRMMIMSWFVKRMRQVQLQLLQGSSVFGEEKSLRIQYYKSHWCCLISCKMVACLQASELLTHLNLLECNLTWREYMPLLSSSLQGHIAKVGSLFIISFFSCFADTLFDLKSLSISCYFWILIKSRQLSRNPFWSNPCDCQQTHFAPLVMKMRNTKVRNFSLTEKMSMPDFCSSSTTIVEPL